MAQETNNQRLRYSNVRSPHSWQKGRYYPRHFTVNGNPFVARVMAIKHVPTDQMGNPQSGSQEELKVGDTVIVGDRDSIPILISGEKYLIAYRNRVVKIK